MIWASLDNFSICDSLLKNTDELILPSTTFFSAGADTSTNCTKERADSDALKLNIETVCRYSNK